MNKEDIEHFGDPAMSDRMLAMPIKCGEKTCAWEPGKFCKFLVTARMGTIWYCSIWHEIGVKGRILPLNEGGGHVLLRRPECLEAERRLKS